MPSTAPPFDDQGYVAGQSSWETYAKAVVACLTASGWDAKISLENPQGVQFSVHVAPEQESAYDEQYELCQAELGGSYREPTMTTERAAAYYKLARQQEACLRGSGYPTPALPSLTTYTTAWEEKGHFDYDPYELIPAADHPTAFASCPRGSVDDQQ